MATKASHEEHTIPTDGGERRRWVRTPAEATEIIVVLERGAQTATVADESYGGIGIRLHEVADIVRGQTLRMLYRGVPVTGVVRGVIVETEGHNRVGLEWLNTHRPTPTVGPRLRKQATQFISFGGFLVACTNTDRNRNGQSDVVLPNGTVCHTRPTDIVQRTYEERMTELAKLKTELTMLLGIYELGEYSSVDAAIAAVLEYEFAKETRVDTALVEELRQKNRELLEQGERIHELESIVRCIVSLCDRVRELELEHSA